MRGRLTALLTAAVLALSPAAYGSPKSVPLPKETVWNEEEVEAVQDLQLIFLVVDGAQCDEDLGSLKELGWQREKDEQYDGCDCMVFSVYRLDENGTPTEKLATYAKTKRENFFYRYNEEVKQFQEVLFIVDEAVG
ncbi:MULTISPECIES: hypothetical protein [Jonquetella]|uniref:Secreted protein n=1 Tax=Jonquetella anthropi DSM 22815 TaxID=885272 RepID=H0UJE9_9BACT|nr:MULTISPECIES: hypothetical protein [Jonquetella]EHM13916.1 hypothetical protein JonanDRAFT_1557 [Jonquetella anthropi DSM 22815]ERL24196.1 hypothetical protein HMPREF1249_0860 [Jonquetella sp. BV3C21]